MAARQGAISVEELIRRKVATVRHWKKTRLYKKHSNWKFQFSVMTYNILSQNAIHNHMYLYKNCNPAFLTEDYRVSRILPEILQSKSDIVCLQEVEEHVYETRIKEVLHSSGFSSVFMKRTTCKSDGCAILWRREKFVFVGQNGIEFRTKNNPLLDRDNIGLIAVLKPNHPRSGNMLLHIATTHLLFNPKRGDVKLCQLRWLLAELERMALIEVDNETRHYHPVILCGDLNIEPHAPLYQFIETGCLSITNSLSGDLSGQAEGRNKGRRVNFANLSLHKLGISEASRFEKVPSKQKTSTKTVESGSNTFPKSALESTGHENPNPATLDPKSNDTNGLSALGSSSDPQWVATLLASSNKQLAADISAQIQNDQGSTKTGEGVTNSSTNYMKCATDSVSEECFTHDFKFIPAYKYTHSSQKALPVTSMVGNEFNNVDHIFYNVKSKRDLHTYHEGYLKLLSIYSLMSEEDLKELGGLPNAGLGSDHIYLMAKFAICFHNHRH